MKRPSMPGEPVPWFRAPALSGNPAYVFDTAAGRHIVLLFFGSAGSPSANGALRLIAEHRWLFDDVRACFFGVTADPGDAAEQRIAQSLPGIRFFLDYDRELAALYGASEPCWLLLDPMLRVIERRAIGEGAPLIARLAEEVGRASEYDSHAPVLVLPRVLEPALCQELIAYYERAGGAESGFMRDVNGKTVGVIDHSYKRRFDAEIDDEQLRGALRERVQRRLAPEITKVFQFHATRMERYIVACYDAGPGGYFRPHRDNTTKGTAHRRFAVTINLNAEDYDGGDLRFPEFGQRTYRAPTGGAVIFSCALLHEATPVTRGRRYAFLPFLYDEAAAAIRAANNKYLGQGVSAYQPDARVVTE